MKRLFSLFLVFMILFSTSVNAQDLNSDAKSIILIESNTGSVLYEFNADQSFPPASVTKIMTLLLVCEKVDAGEIALTDMVTASANASAMGGSQIYLKEGEKMSVEDLIKSIVISSANDSAVALAEHIAGSEESFVKMMNEKAKELGMKGAYFVNTNGLDDSTNEHVCSARDIALMSKELLKHTWILNYTNIWMDQIREGQFGLTNTNRLIRSYPGANGLKTGFTAKAGYCISATAKRENMQLIAVVMGANTRDSRNKCAADVLDFGFDNFKFFSLSPSEISEVKIIGAVRDTFKCEYDGFECVRLKSDPDVSKEIILNENLTAPIKKGDVVGRVELKCGNEIVSAIDIRSSEDVDKMSFFDTLELLTKKWLLL